MHVGNTRHWKPAASRRSDLDDQARDFDHQEYCPDAQQDTHQDSNMSAHVNSRQCWHLCGQTQTVMSTQMSAVTSGNKSASSKSTNACGHIREAARCRSSSSSNRTAKGLLLLL